MNTFFQNTKRANFLILVIIVAAAALACIPLLRGDFFHFSDEPHIANLFEMVRALASGQIPPRWAPDMSFEFGYPLFNFYYVLPYYLGSVVYFFTHSLIFSLKSVFLVSVPLSGIFMYLWLRKHTDVWAAFLGSVLYIFTPYRAVDLYVRGAVGEALAFVFFPLILLAIYRVFEKKRPLDIGVLGIVTGLFFLTHNLAPILFLPFAALYAVVLGIKFKSKREIFKVILGFFLGLGAASFFVLPAFLEKGLLTSQTPFNFMDHFPFIKQLIYSPFKYGASLPGPNDDLSFQVGIVNWILFILGVIFFPKIKKEGRPIYFLFMGTFLFSLFLMNIRSAFLWKIFLLSDYIQFPWRLLMLTSFLTSSFVIFLSPIKKYRNYLLGGLALVVIVINFGYFKPSGYFSPDDNYFLKRFFARNTSEGIVSEVSKDYLNYSEDYLLLSKLTEKRPQSLPADKFTSETLKLEEIKKESEVSYSARVLGEGLLVFNSYYFPGWNGEVDGEVRELKPIEPDGSIGIEITQGENEVKIYWQETASRKIFDLISLFCLIFLLVLIVFNAKMKRFI